MPREIKIHDRHVAESAVTARKADKDIPGEVGATLSGSVVKVLAEKGGHGFRHYPLASRSQDVVRRALRDSALNLRVSTPGLVCTLHRAAAKVTPNLLCLPLADCLSHV